MRDVRIELNGVLFMLNDFFYVFMFSSVFCFFICALDFFIGKVLSLIDY